LVKYLAFLISANLVIQAVGLHAGAAWLTLLSWAFLPALSLLDVEQGLHAPVLFPLLPRERLMHRDWPDCNLAVLTSICDRMAGTFRPHKTDAAKPPKRPTEEKKWYEKAELMPEPPQPEPTPERLEVLPSLWTSVTFSALLIASTAAVELCYTGNLPRRSDFVHMSRAVFALAQFVVVCAAGQSAATTKMPDPLPPRQDGLPRAKAKPQTKRNFNLLDYRGPVSNENNNDFSEGLRLRQKAKELDADMNMEKVLTVLSSRGQ
jgi:hypothetical protein